jgi:hypothetical protein
MDLLAISKMISNINTKKTRINGIDSSRKINNQQTIKNTEILCHRLDLLHNHRPPIILLINNKWYPLIITIHIIPISFKLLIKV